MQEFFGQCNGPLLIVHGGAGKQDPKENQGLRATEDLCRIVQDAWKLIPSEQDSLNIVLFCLKEMEKNPVFNCGYGSAIQGDGEARLTAAMMEGERQIFSGVINVSGIVHPSILAKHLQRKESRVVTGPGLEKLIADAKVEKKSPISPERLKQYEDDKKTKKNYDTVGCVYRDKNGKLFSGTTTGGRGFEFPGRVSDVATVAGTYASKFGAFSATGVGEQIVEAALCARMETRVRDKMRLKDAAVKCRDEAVMMKHEYGWIGISADGSWCSVFTTECMTFAVMDASGILAKSEFS